MIPDILQGFDNDCKKLIVSFEQESSISFSVFCDIWKDMNFTLIYSGRTPKEIVYLTFEALAFTKSFFFHSTSFLRKIACLYIMYGLYYKQPIRDTGKILITLKEWLEIKDFIQTLQQNDHLEVLYIILKLIFDDAFHFVYLNSKKVTPIRATSEYYNKDITDEELNNESLGINNLLDELEGIESAYNNSKTEVTTTLKIPEIKYACDNITTILKDILKSNLDTTPKIEINSPGTSEIQNNDSTLLNKRLSLKQKSFKSKKKRIFLDRLNSKTKYDDSDISDENC